MSTISVNCELVPRMSTGPILGYRTAIESESLNVLADVINVMQSYCMIILKFDRTHLGEMNGGAGPFSGLALIQCDG